MHCLGVVSCTARKHTQKHTQTHTRTSHSLASLPLDDVMLLKYTRPEEEADQGFEILGVRKHRRQVAHFVLNTNVEIWFWQIPPFL